jgi:hypothetical protein
MHCGSRIFIGRIDQAKHVAVGFIKPILDVLDAVFVLRSQIGLVCVSYGIGRKAFDLFMNIHE